MQHLGFTRVGDPKGKPLAIVHGWGCDSSFLLPIANMFRERDIFLIDLPGYGESTHLAPFAQDLVSTTFLLINTLPDGADLFAWSFGTLYVLRALSLISDPTFRNNVNSIDVLNKLSNIPICPSLEPKALKHIQFTHKTPSSVHLSFAQESLQENLMIAEAMHRALHSNRQVRQQLMAELLDEFEDASPDKLQDSTIPYSGPTPAPDPVHVHAPSPTPTCPSQATGAIPGSSSNSITAASRAELTGTGSTGSAATVSSSTCWQNYVDKFTPGTTVTPPSSESGTCDSLQFQAKVQSPVHDHTQAPAIAQAQSQDKAYDHSQAQIQAQAQTEPLERAIDSQQLASTTPAKDYHWPNAEQSAAQSPTLNSAQEAEQEITDKQQSYYYRLLRQIKIPNIHSLVTICGSPRFPADPNWPGINPVRILKLNTELNSRRLKTVLNLFYHMQFSVSNPQLDRLLKICLSTNPPVSDAVLMSGIHQVSYMDERPALEHLSIPSLHMFGAKDRLVPCQIAQFCPHDALHSSYIFPYSAHNPFLTEPEEFERQIRQFFDRIKTYEAKNA